MNFTARRIAHTRRNSAIGWSGRGASFAKYDVEADAEANARLRTLTGGAANVPVLVENGKVIQVGWLGRSCFFDTATDAG